MNPFYNSNVSLLLNYAFLLKGRFGKVLHSATPVVSDGGGTIDSSVDIELCSPFACNEDVLEINFLAFVIFFQKIVQKEIELDLQTDAAAGILRQLSLDLLRPYGFTTYRILGCNGVGNSGPLVEFIPPMFNIKIKNNFGASKDVLLLSFYMPVCTMVADDGREMARFSASTKYSHGDENGDLRVLGKAVMEWNSPSPHPAYDFESALTHRIEFRVLSLFSFAENNGLVVEMGKDIHVHTYLPYLVQNAE